MTIKKQMPFTRINKILPKVVKTAGIKVKIDESKVLDNFNDVAVNIFGEAVLKKMKPLYVKDGTLILACLSDLLIERIKQSESRFLWELNKPLGKKVISKIRFLA